MYTINFGKWSKAALRFFTYDRFYYKGYKWTPFVKMRLRK